jgi:hypothetical protein
MPTPKEKRYIVRKYIMAKSAAEAMKKDRTAWVDDVWVDEEWLDEQTKQIGFKTS